MKIRKLILLPLIIGALSIASCTNNNNQGGGTNSSGTNSSGTGGDNPPPSGYVKDEWTPIPLGGTIPIGKGNTTVSGPDNISNPDDISKGKAYTLTDALPNNWTWIQGNNKVAESNAKFYPATDGGGLKFSSQYYGVQTSAFTAYKYVDVKLKIGAVKENSKGASEDDILHIYGYNAKSDCILQKKVEQGSITVQTKGQYVSLTICNDAMCYFEIRLNAFPSKGEQGYNFGITEVNLKGRN